MKSGRRLLIACALVVGLVACGQQRSTDPQAMALAVAQGIYNNDLNAATQNFDAELKSQATRTQVAMISDKMHALGTLQGLTETKRDEDTRRYWYEAKFDKGVMEIEMKLHANGTIAAYRMIPKTG